VQQDEFVLNDSVLQQRMHRYLDQSGVRKFQAGILRVMDYAVQARLRSVLEALVRARHLRSRRLAGRSADGSFTTLPLRVTSDPGAALRYAERLMRAAEMYRAAADRRALREQKRVKKAAAESNNNGDGDGDEDESEEFDDDEEESDESDVVISNEDDDEEDEQDDDDDDDDDPDADVDDKSKKRKRGAAAVKRGPARKGKRAKAGAAAAGASGPSDEMTQAEAARQARLDRLKALEEQQRERASMDSAASVALNNVGVVKDKDELQRKLKEREDTRDKLKKRLGELNFKESERALLLKLRGQKSGQMEASEVAQLRMLEVRWEAFKKLSEMVSAFAKEIENLNQQINADPEAERQRLLESEAEHLASRVAEQAAMVGGVPVAPVTASASTTASSTAAEPAQSKRRRRGGVKDEDDDDDYDEGAAAGGGGGGGGGGSELKIEPTTARTAAKAGLAFYNVEPEPELPLAERLATPAYTTPQVTLDDCQMLRNTEIPSHVFDRFEIAQLKQRAAVLEQSMK
jgi:hypothetical protein